MLVYLVGQQELVDNGEVGSPFYYGYTTNQQIANAYYEMLIARFKKDDPSSTVTDVLFIQKVSEDKFNKMDEFRYIEEIEEYDDGVYMTGSDYEYLTDSISACFDEITHELSDGALNLFIKKLKRYGKYSTNKELKKSMYRFIKASADLCQHFGDFGDACKDIKWAKALRKFW